MLLQPPCCIEDVNRAYVSESKFVSIDVGFIDCHTSCYSIRRRSLSGALAGKEGTQRFGLRLICFVNFIAVLQVSRVPCKKALGLWGLPYQNFDNNNLITAISNTSWIDICVHFIHVKCTTVPVETMCNKTMKM